MRFPFGYSRNQGKEGGEGVIRSGSFLDTLIKQASLALTPSVRFASSSLQEGAFWHAHAPASL